MRISVITPTHDPKWLNETWESLKAQTHQDWEWVLVPNGQAIGRDVTLFASLAKDKRVRMVPLLDATTSVGAIKKFAFGKGEGDVLFELDHDDVLAPTALAEVDDLLTKRPEIDFVYSDCADWSPKGDPVVYHDPASRAAWEAEGWRFTKSEMDGRKWLHPLTWEPTALALSIIMHAPNHLRAWRRQFYRDIGGHNAELAVCDDHELVIRTYLHGNMARIPKLLYRYRIDGTNTWLQRQAQIRAKTYALREQYLHRLIARQCVLDEAPAYDLGGAFGSPGEPWKRVDSSGDADVVCDLRERWPFEDSSVGAFRAVDIFEHLPDKLHTMSEVYRCLRPGGWLISQTPSALGAGAFQDPTHCSYWVENSFRYYTEQRFARYLRNTTERFMAVRLFETNTDGEIPYVVADLISLKDDKGAFPGRRLI